MLKRTLFVLVECQTSARCVRRTLSSQCPLFSCLNPGLLALQATALTTRPWLDLGISSTVQGSKLAKDDNLKLSLQILTLILSSIDPALAQIIVKLGLELFLTLWTPAALDKSRWILVMKNIYEGAIGNAARIEIPIVTTSQFLHLTLLSPRNDVDWTTFLVDLHLLIRSLHVTINCLNYLQGRWRKYEYLGFSIEP